MPGTGDERSDCVPTGSLAPGRQSGPAGEAAPTGGSVASAQACSLEPVALGPASSS